MDKLNNYEDIKSKKIELLEEEKKNLLINVVKIFSESTLNSPNLGEFKNENISTVNVVSRINELGLMEIAKEILPKVILVPIPDYMIEAKAAEYERFFRIFLKETEEIIKKRSLKK